MKCTSAEAADVVLLNTCSVRAKPEEKVWSELGRLRDIKRDRPDLIIGVCGCMAQVESVEIKRRAPHVDMVVGTGNIAAIPDMIRRVQAGEVRRRYRVKGDRGRGCHYQSRLPTPQNPFFPYSDFRSDVAGQVAEEHADGSAIAAAQGRGCQRYSCPRRGAQDRN